MEKKFYQAMWKFARQSNICSVENPWKEVEW